MNNVTKKERKELLHALLRRVKIDGEYVMARRRRTCAHCKKKLVRRTGRGRPSCYCSRACKQKAYRVRSHRPPVDPLMLMRQDLRQVLETDRLKHVALEVFKDMGVFDFLERLGFQPPEPQPPQLRLIKPSQPPT